MSSLLPDNVTCVVIAARNTDVTIATAATIVVALDNIDVVVANWSVFGQSDGRCSIQARYGEEGVSCRWQPTAMLGRCFTSEKAEVRIMGDAASFSPARRQWLLLMTEPNRLSQSGAHVF